MTDRMMAHVLAAFGRLDVYVEQPEYAPVDFLELPPS